MPESVLSQTARLPGGYTATFRWSGHGAYSVEWDPSVPCIQSRRLQRKFMDAYTQARREFVTAMATSLGGSVLIADLKQGFIDWPTDASRMRRQLSPAADIASDGLW